MLAFASGLAWSYWPTLCELARRWSDEPQYSHGFLVPAISAAMLWIRRRELAAGAARPTWWGVPVLIAGVLLRCAGAYFYVDWLDAVSLLPCLVAFALLAGGTSALRWSWQAIAFLMFMIPLPHAIETAVIHPMQGAATAVSTYLLQLIGLPALADGNVIHLSETDLGVVEACGGLRMLFCLLAVAAAAAIVWDAPAWQKALLMLSAAPVALASNVTRITLTGVFEESFGGRAVAIAFHHWGGWLMMPLALGLLWLQLRLASRLVRQPACLHTTK